MSHRQERSRTEPAALPTRRPTALQTGQLLPTLTQNEMSAKFGHDFSSVRIHTDSRAGESAEAMGANAYAVGSDIVFGEGKYTPGSPETERLLAHELTHVAQQSQLGEGDWGRVSQKGDASEREADSLADHVAAGRPVRVQAAPQAALARDEEEGGWASNLASSVWGGTKAAAGAVYDGYEKGTDFKKLDGALGNGVDWVEKKSAEGNQKMVDDSKGHWYEGLAKADAWVNNEATQATGGLVKGVGDLTTGLAGGLAHPIDAAAGMEGILEHNMTVPGLGSTLKAGHGAYDILSGKKDGEYGNSWGDLANHVFNPVQQMKDDQKFDTDLATNIIAPDKNKDGTTDWSAWKNKPMEAATRALVNVAPIALGVGEAAAGDAAAEGASKAVNPASAPELAPVTERGAPSIPGVGPGRTPTIPGLGEPGPSLPAPDTIPNPVVPDLAPDTVPSPSVPAPDTIPNPVLPKPAIELPPNINPLDPRIEPPSVPGAPDNVPNDPGVPDTRREIPLPPKQAPIPDAPGPESDIPSQPPTPVPLPQSDPLPYIRPYEEEWLKTPWRKPNIPEFG